MHFQKLLAPHFILRTSVVAFTLALATMVSTSALASILTVDRGLPTAHLNETGDYRSNTDFAFGSAWAGDTFSLDTASVIDQLTVWVLADPAFGPNFGGAFAGMTLYLGPASGTQISKVSSATFTGAVSSNADVTVSQVHYVGGADYLVYGGSYFNIWELNFFNLGAHTAGDYIFALAGTPSSSINSAPTYVHASNAALGGVTADGANGYYYLLYGDAGDAALVVSGPFFADYHYGGIAWDKAADLNVMVYTTVPLPAALPLAISAFGSLGGQVILRRRKRRA